MEEDTAKQIHLADITLIDYNREESTGGVGPDQKR